MPCPLCKKIAFYNQIIEFVAFHIARLKYNNYNFFFLYMNKGYRGNNQPYSKSLHHIINSVLKCFAIIIQSTLELNLWYISTLLVKYIIYCSCHSTCHPFIIWKIKLTSRVRFFFLLTWMSGSACAYLD
jgi:hypothetical protein